MKPLAFRLLKPLLPAVVVAILAGLPEGVPAAGPGQFYQAYQTLLDRYVHERDLPGGGLISAFDYRAALASNDTATLLARQRERLAGFDTGSLDSRAPAIAFWINAYNFFMLDYILRHPDDGRPPDGVRDYGTLFSPYRLFERELFDIGGRNYSLQQIELDVLLGDAFAARGWKDARVHFMVNCASVGCPALRDRIYTADNLEAMLAVNTRRALDTPLHLERRGEVLRVTSLFDWYAGDFVEQSGSVRAFIRDHGSESARSRLDETDRLSFIEYDWSLNSPENFDAVLRTVGAEPFD